MDLYCSSKFISNKTSMKKASLFLIFLSIASISIAQMPKKAERVAVNGKHLYYEVYGAGKPLIFLHGYTLSSRMWTSFIADFNGGTGAEN